MNPHKTESAPAAGAPTVGPVTPTATHTGCGAVLDSRTVMGGMQAITIAHNGSFYRLQTTRQGKLILTK